MGQIVYSRGQCTPQTDFCYIDIGSIDNKHQQLSSEETIIAADKAPSRARKIVAAGDILYSTVRPYLHNMCIIDRDFSCTPIASTGFAAMACHDGILNRFIFYYLMSPDFDAYANNTDNSKGVAYPAINDDRLGHLDLYSKGGKLRRIYIPKALQDEALSWLSGKHQESGFIFLNKYGDRITTRGISGQLKKLAARYDINPAVVYPHSFRHRFAKSFLERCNDIAFLADLMGHESIETTRIYLRKTSTEQRAIVDDVVDW